MALADKDVDTEMADSWKEIQDKYALEEEPAPAEVEIEPPVETIPVSRKPDGKFKARDADAADTKGPKPKEAKATPAALDPAKPAPSKEGAVPAEPAEQPPGRDINRAPSSWKPAARAEFEKLSPALKAEIHRRELDFQNGQQQLIPDATLGRSLREVIKPYELMIQAEGGTPERAVADLLRTAALFRVGSAQQKQQAIATIANQFGIDLRVFSAQSAPAGQPPPQQPFRDPRVDQLLAMQTQERQLAAQRETQAMEATVTRWMNETDAQGNPKREYLGDVINEMSALVPQIRSADPTLTHAQALDAAYDRAIWAHPEVRTLLAQRQHTEQEAARRAENQRRVSEARRAGSVNVARRASTPAPGKPGTLEQTIAATARELGLIT